MVDDAPLIYDLVFVEKGLCCNPLTLQPEQSGGVGSMLSRVPLLERHDIGSRT